MNEVAQALIDAMKAEALALLENAKVDATEAGRTMAQFFTEISGDVAAQTVAAMAGREIAESNLRHLRGQFSAVLAKTAVNLLASQRQAVLDSVMSAVKVAVAVLLKVATGGIA